MSLSYEPLQPILVRDSRLMLNSIRTCAVLKGGQNVSFKQFTTTNVSSSAIGFSTPPPSNNVVTDRKVLFSLPIRLSLTGTCPNLQNLISPSRDAPRAFPISSSIETLTCVFNNQQVNINLCDIINPLMHYNTDTKDKNGSWSTTPTYQDQTSNYDDLAFNNRNPLGTYGDSLDDCQIGRGAFPFKIIANPVSNGVDPVTAIIDVLFTETIYLSPLHFTNSGACGFYNLTTMDWNFNFTSTMWARIWSHSTRAGDSIITSGNVVFGGALGGPDSASFPKGSPLQPTLLLQFITPCENQIIPQHPITYPYSNIVRYTTDIPSTASGNNVVATTNNVQLNQVPSRIYIYVAEQKNSLFSNASNTDTFFQINNISMQFLNLNGIFSSASMQQLYEISKKNGCNMTYTQWSGGPVFKTNSFTPISTIGSVFCCEPQDFGLPSSLAPSVLSQCQLQLQVSATNLSGRTINPSIYVIIINQGSFTLIGSGSATVNLGVLSQDDVLNSSLQEGVPMSEVTQFSGGNWFTSLKEWGSKLMPYVQRVHDFVKDNKLISSALTLVPANTPYGIGPGSKAAAVVARSFGYGKGGDYGDIVMGSGNAGGQQLRKQDLRARMAQY